MVGIGSSLGQCSLRPNAAGSVPLVVEYFVEVRNFGLCEMPVRNGPRLGQTRAPQARALRENSKTQLPAKSVSAARGTHGERCGSRIVRGLQETWEAGMIAIQYWGRVIGCVRMAFFFLFLFQSFSCYGSEISHGGLGMRAFARAIAILVSFRAGDTP